MSWFFLIMEYLKLIKTVNYHFLNKSFNQMINRVTGRYFWSKIVIIFIKRKIENVKATN